MRMGSLRWGMFAQVFAAGILLASAARGQQPPAVLTRDAAVYQALAQNPFLATVRKQSGYAEAALIVAKTYPFNPVYTGYVTSATGPTPAGITNTVYQEHYVSLELELRGQRKHRQAAASAAASRIEWEIANQEIGIAVAVVRAYNAGLYRQRKLELLEAGMRVNEFAFEQMQKQAAAGKGKGPDLVLARIDLDAGRAQLGQARTLVATSRSDLRKLLGRLDDCFLLVGDLGVPLPSTDADALAHLALDQRADIQARRSALFEAEALLRLVNANRYGNISAGPYFEFDPTSIVYLGARLSTPLAVLNTRRGEIHKAETDVAKVRAEIDQLELQARQEVQAALSRLAESGKWAASYQADVLPPLLKAKDDIEKQYAAKDPNLDFARLLTIQRTYLKASENLLDAAFERSQAQADLALSVAEPALAIGPGYVTPTPTPLQHGK